MTITISYHAQARTAAGKAIEQIDLPGPLPISSLLAFLAQRHGEKLACMLFGADGSPCPSLLLFIDDQQVRPDSRRVLNDGDELFMLSPMAGG